MKTGKDGGTRLSRRKLLASLGLTGAAFASGGLLKAFGSAEGNVMGAVYGNPPGWNSRNGNPPWLLNSRTFNVKDWGVVGDGNTPGDRNLIQSKMAELQPGDVLYFPPEVDILCQQAIDITVPKLRVTGSGRLRLGADNTYIMRIYGDDVIVDGLIFHNPAGLKRMGEPHGQGTRSGAVEIRAHRVTVTQCQIDQMLIGILVNSGSSTVEYTGTRIVNNQITNCLGAGREDLGDAVCVFGSDAVVANNYITCKSGEDPRIGINIEALVHVGWPVQRNQDGHGAVVGNVVVGGFRRAIHIEADGVSVTGNAVKGQTFWGIMNYGSRNVISNNVVESPKYKTAPPEMGWNPVTSGIQIYRGKAVIVEGNTLLGGSANGVRVYKQAEGVTIKGNQLIGDSPSNTQFGIGIFIDEAHGCIIEGNMFAAGSCSGRGISIWKAKELIIKGNHVKGCGAEGMKLEGTVGVRHDTLIEGNVVKNNVGRAVFLANYSFTTVCGNNITDDQQSKTQTEGIYLYNTDDCLIYGNGLDGNLNAALHNSLSDRLVMFGNRGLE
ncbi:right-handed parallel beta-helix repeat-containing protein [Paenibacillus silviterrae]|uniref:right-handed parallel beta-helix repeat-containing protein n=1 Tax=Paenibacillus silviterrae TaxID=3242194 RepID=UPI00254339A6|nr:NosD domain-containing protein [Paenibacillus chinjuensis]